MGSFASACRRAIVKASALSPLLLALLAFGAPHAAAYELQLGTTNLLVAVEGTHEALEAAESARAVAAQGVVDAPQVEQLFETDVPAPAGARATAAPATRRSWLLVLPSKTKAMSASQLDAASKVNPWDTAHDVVDGRGSGSYKDLHKLLLSSSAVRVITVEPDVHYVDQELMDRMSSQFKQLEATKCKPPSAPGMLRVCKAWKDPWPHPDRFAWHLEKDYSQLAQARDSVPETSDEERVTVAHLDTGYDPSANGTNPPHFDPWNSYDFTGAADPKTHKPKHCGGQDTDDHGFPFYSRGHGTGTLGILAAGEVEIQADHDEVPPFKGRLGGVPQARVVEYRVSGSIGNWNTGPMAWAIATAPDEKVDVISMSMGAVPSQALVDAVNKAYLHGTAVVTAAGNYFLVPILGFHTPTRTVPPAYFNRVLSVTGVTSAERSYSKAPCFPSFLCEPLWTMRGSFGPRFAMQEAIASYTPNIPWIIFSDSTKGIPPGAVRLNGEGTSAATPQVAAAVALWLQKHRKEFDTTEWRSWRKVQAAFDVIRASANPSSHSARYQEKYFGAGILQAADALERERPCDLAPRPEATIGFFWVDFFLNLPGPVVAGGDRLAPTDPELLRVHQAMFKSELAQLVFASRGLQEVLGELQSDVLDGDPARRIALLEAVRKDSNSSQHLRDAIKRALAQSP